MGWICMKDRREVIRRGLFRLEEEKTTAKLSGHVISMSGK
jgi:hypothetical protein